MRFPWCFLGAHPAPFAVPAWNPHEKVSAALWWPLPRTQTPPSLRSRNLKGLAASPCPTSFGVSRETAHQLHGDVYLKAPVIVGAGRCVKPAGRAGARQEPAGHSGGGSSSSPGNLGFALWLSRDGTRLTPMTGSSPLLKAGRV